MNRTGNLKNQFLSFENLYSGYKKAFKATKNYSACEFTFKLDKELLCALDACYERLRQ